MAKLCLLDIGNTHTRCAISDNDQINLLFSKNTADFRREDIPNNMPLAVASVVPDVSQKIYHADILFISSEIDTGIDFSLVNSPQLGADRIANLVALSLVAKRLPAAIIDCGTAITLEVLDNKKRFLGGVIAPGRILQRKALKDYTALLPLVETKTYSHTDHCSFGWNTEDSIVCGTNYGVVGMCREFINITREQLGTPNIDFYATGGDENLLLQNIEELKRVPANFTLLGILEIWKRQNNKT